MLEAGSGTKFQLLPLFNIVGPFSSLTRNLGARHYLPIEKTHQGHDVSYNVEYIVIHMRSIFAEPHYPPAKVAMLLVTNEGILYALHTPTSSIKLHLVKPSFYSFMKIHETTFMKVLHTMDLSWCDADLNDDGPSFYHTFIYMGPQWHGSSIPKFRWKINKIAILACWMKNNKALMILGEWM